MIASCSFAFLFVLGFLALALLIIGVYRGKWSGVLSLVKNVECNRSLQYFHDASGGRCWRGYSICVVAFLLPRRAHLSIDLPSDFVISLSIDVPYCIFAVAF